ncbi:MAG: hypothetical protein RQM90_14470 [Methanoculleus sp.]
MNAYTKGTDWTELSAPLPDGGSATLRYYADKNGELWITQSADSISSGTYGAITLSGEAVADTIIADMTVTGTKKGQDDGTISFALGGVEHGTATVAVFIDGSEVLSQKIAIGTPTSSGGNGGTDGNGGSSSSGGPGAAPPPPPPLPQSSPPLTAGSPSPEPISRAQRSSQAQSRALSPPVGPRMGAPTP